jgi:hypothetical protein
MSAAAHNDDQRVLWLGADFMPVARVGVLCCRIDKFRDPDVLGGDRSNGAGADENGICRSAEPNP